MGSGGPHLRRAGRRRRRFASTTTRPSPTGSATASPVAPRTGRWRCPSAPTAWSPDRVEVDKGELVAWTVRNAAEDGELVDRHQGIPRARAGPGRRGRGADLVPAARLAPGLAASRSSRRRATRSWGRWSSAVPTPPTRKRRACELAGPRHRVARVPDQPAEPLGGLLRGAVRRRSPSPIAYFGMVTSGYAGFQDFTRTAASLVNVGASSSRSSPSCWASSASSPTPSTSSCWSRSRSPAPGSSWAGTWGSSLTVLGAAASGLRSPRRR